MGEGRPRARLRLVRLAWLLAALGVAILAEGGSAWAAASVHLAQDGSRACQTCHRTGSGGGVATVPSGNQLCYDCHLNSLGSSFARVPFEQGAHGPLWTQRNSRTPFARKGRSAAERGLCVNCHDPHGGGETRSLLRLGSRQDSTAMCVACHVDAQAYGAYSGPKVYAASPHGNSLTGVARPGTGFATGECLNCHDPHGKGYAKLLVEPRGNELCLRCHEAPSTGVTSAGLWPGKVAFQAAGGVHANPPVVPKTGVRRTYPGRDALPGSCVNCHNPHGSMDARTGQLTAGMTNAAGSSLCYQCHPDLRFAFTSLSRHGVDDPASGLTCLSCHNPHLVSRLDQPVTDPKQPGVRMSFPATAATTRTTAYNAFCLRCHDGSTALAGNVELQLASASAPGGFSGGGRNLHYAHVTERGLGCANCHASHGSSNRALLRTWITVIDPAYGSRQACGTSGQPGGLICHT
ncbi:MAG: cytochrome c3 family protein [Chitinophagales bacterium]